MFSHSRKLLVLAALCWVAPLSAHQPPAAPHGKAGAAAAHKHRGDCPKKAAAKRAKQGAASAMISSDGVPAGVSLFDFGSRDSRFLP